MTATLIGVQNAKHVPPPLTGDDKAKLDEFYKTYGVLEATACVKSETLKKIIQARNFYALGGNETPEMELRANERIYLLKHGAK